VQRGLRLLVVAAAAPLLSGCFYFPPVGGGGSSEYAATSEAESNVRSAVPAIEAYYADNGTYEGATPERLRVYDGALPVELYVVEATKDSYCIESTVDGASFHKRGPASDIVPGTCASAPAQPLLPEPARTLHTAVEAMELYRSLNNGSYEGARTAALSDLGPGLGGVRVVRATRDSFCLELTVGGRTWVARETGDVGVGARC
jgi:hypothetical protein